MKKVKVEKKLDLERIPNLKHFMKPFMKQDDALTQEQYTPLAEDESIKLVWHSEISQLIWEEAPYEYSGDRMSLLEVLSYYGELDALKFLVTTWPVLIKVMFSPERHKGLALRLALENGQTETIYYLMELMETHGFSLNAVLKGNEEKMLQAAIKGGDPAMFLFLFQQMEIHGNDMSEILKSRNYPLIMQSLHENQQDIFLFLMNKTKELSFDTQVLEFLNLIQALEYRVLPNHDAKFVLDFGKMLGKTNLLFENNYAILKRFFEHGDPEQMRLLLGSLTAQQVQQSLYACAVNGLLVSVQNKHWEMFDYLMAMFEANIQPGVDFKTEDELLTELYNRPFLSEFLPRKPKTPWEFHNLHKEIGTWPLEKLVLFVQSSYRLEHMTYAHPVECFSYYEGALELSKYLHRRLAPYVMNHILKHNNYASVKYAIEQNNPETLRFLIEIIGDNFEFRFVEMAIELGHAQLLEVMLGFNRLNHEVLAKLPALLEMAARKGQPDVFFILMKKAEVTGLSLQEIQKSLTLLTIRSVFEALSVALKTLKSKKDLCSDLLNKLDPENPEKLIERLSAIECGGMSDFIKNQQKDPYIRNYITGIMNKKLASKQATENKKLPENSPLPDEKPVKTIQPKRINEETSEISTSGLQTNSLFCTSRTLDKSASNPDETSYAKLIESLQFFLKFEVSELTIFTKTEKIKGKETLCTQIHFAREAEDLPIFLKILREHQIQFGLSDGKNNKISLTAFALERIITMHKNEQWILNSLESKDYTLFNQCLPELEGKISVCEITRKFGKCYLKYCFEQNDRELATKVLKQAPDHLQSVIYSSLTGSVPNFSISVDKLMEMEKQLSAEHDRKANTPG